ncbi:MAG: hypothetical protein R3300_17750 [Candidatus Promineifilaceae bacterium]|nr:hypothetical protein [Candidatus Promineifilaceae bacterium]
MTDRISSESYLGLLVALLSVLTAFAAYQVARVEALASEHDVQAIKTLTESNTEYLRANQEVMLDYAAFDNFVVEGEGDPEVADFYRSGFSAELEAGMARPEGPFDDLYFEQMFSEADLLYEEALDGFDAGEAVGETADRLQLIMLALAVGLSLAAFASIGDRTSRIGRLFILIATAALLYGLVHLGVVLL